MSAGPCHLTTDDGNFFDVTHTFKSGLATYHILGLRRDRPTYRNTYYVFNCTDPQHENEVLPTKSVRFKRSLTSSSPHQTRRISVEDATRRPVSTRPRTQSPKKEENDITSIEKELTKAIRNNRELLLASIRKEMNVKKKSILRSMKKDKETLLQATSDANKNDEIIRLLEEQKQALTDAHEQYLNATTESIDSLKKTLIDTLENHHDISQSTEQLQTKLIETIEKHVQKIVEKNDEILRLTSAETHAIHQLQSTIIKKIEDQSNIKKQHEDETLKRLFAEQQRVLTNVVEQQQQTFSIDLVKQTIHDALNERKSISMNMTNQSDHPQLSTIASTSSEQNLVDSKIIPKRMTRSLTHTRPNQSLPKITSKTPVDDQLFKVSIHSSEPAHLYAKLMVEGMECSRRLHTLCQRDPVQKDLYNCYIAPPKKDGPYEVTIYARTNKEAIYRAAISIRLPGSHSSQPISFPMIHQAFEQHQCVLIEPLHRLFRRNEQIFIHMIIPGAELVKIRNGEENMDVDVNEYKNNVMKKRIRVRGDVHIIACWDRKTDSTLCVFNVI